MKKNIKNKMDCGELKKACLTGKEQDEVIYNMHNEIGYNKLPSLSITFAEINPRQIQSIHLNS